MLIKQIKLSSLSKAFLQQAALALITLVPLINLGCGKKSPPLPPVERVRQRVVISGYQQGNVINLAWTMPARNEEEGSILNVDRVDIYRLAEPTGASLPLTEEEFAARSTLINSLPVSDADFALKRLTYRDTLDFAGQAVRLRYAIRFVNASGQKAGFSNFLLIEPTTKIAAPPSLLSPQVSEIVISLSWTPPQANVDGSTPANILGYNIYRRGAENEDFKILNNQPVTQNTFGDSFFEFEKTYTYVARTVSLGGDGKPIESLNSNTISVTPKDTFPPSAPTALTAAASQNNISVFFAVNPEQDIVGYRVYRTTDANTPKNEWQLLTKEIVTTNTFQDATVESGKTYFYYVIAVDKAGNVSEPSEVVSETAP